MHKAFNIEPALYSIQQVCRCTSLGRTTIYAAAKRGDLRITKYGNRSIVLADDLKAFLAGISRNAREIARDNAPATERREASTRSPRSRYGK
jgi:excisionase family DNA binding protein